MTERTPARTALAVVVAVLAPAIYAIICTWPETADIVENGNIAGFIFCLYGVVIGACSVGLLVTLINDEFSK